MNSFAAIKYPITTEFKVEDLERIPPEIINDWWFDRSSRLSGAVYREKIPAIPERISWYMNIHTTKSIRIAMLRLLKYEIDDWYTNNELI